MRRNAAPGWHLPALLLVPLLSLLLPHPGWAQGDRVDRGGFSLELFRGFPFDLVATGLGIDRRTILGEDPSAGGGLVPADSVISASYRERATAPREVAGAVRWSPGESLALTARVRLGSSDTETTFKVFGFRPETFQSRVAWTGLDVTASVPLAAGERWRFEGIAGADRTWWTLETGGIDGSHLVREATLDPDPPPVTWTDRTWSTLGLILGTRVELAPAPGWALGLEVLERVYSVGQHALTEGMETDLRAGTGRTVRLSGGGAHRVLSTSAALSLAWRPLVRTVEDPASGVLSAREARGVEEAGGPDPQASLPAEYHEAMERADTLEAIRVLEAAYAALPDHESNPAVVGELGLLLAYTSPTEELDFTQRKRAAELLERALKLDPDNPRYYLALGVVYDKALLRGDARLVINRGLEAAADHPTRISDEELADAFFRRGHTLEEWIKEFVNLKNVPADQAQLGTLGCQVIGDAFCLNWNRPRHFFDHFQFFPDLSDLVDDDRALMVREYERAVGVDPTHAGAWRGILRARARTRDWKGLLDDARRWAGADTANPWSRIMLAAALVKAEEDWASAEPLFREALLELGEADRRVFQDLTPLLRSREEEAWARRGPVQRDLFRQAYFKAQDPLYLSEANERRAAHYTRVALAELLFGEPQSGRRGWATDRGRIVVRYGLPETRWMVRRDERRVLRTQGLEGAPTAGDMGGGRWIFWNYDPDEPSFIFEKRLGRPSVYHMAGSQSIFMAQDLKAEQPTAFADPFRAVGPMPFQMALFRSARGRGYELEVHGLMPVEELAGPNGPDSVLTGLFLDRTSNWDREAEVRAVQEADDPGLDIRVRGLGPGLYRYSLEAAAPDRSAASVARGELAVRTYSASGLLLSDLLLARDVVGTVPEPGTRFDLSVDPLRCLALPGDRSLWVVFEAYGLEVADGTARYRIDLLTEGEGGNPVLSFLRGLADPFLGEAGPEGRGLVSYEREVPAREDRVVEWFRVELPEGLEGETELRIRVRDLRSDASAETARTLSPEACRGAGPP